MLGFTKVTRRVITLLTFFICSLVLFLPQSNAVTNSGKKAIDGSTLYHRWCSQCHGLVGKGDGINSTPDMEINPRNLSDGSFMSTRTDKQLENTIRDGGIGIGKSPLMPTWGGTLPDKEIKALVTYLRKLCKCRFEGVTSDEKLKIIVPNFR